MPNSVANTGFQFTSINITTSLGEPRAPASNDGRDIVWFDIDNCLYSKSVQVASLMYDKIHKYFLDLGLSPEEANVLHKKYYTEYGLAIKGLVQYHQVDPLDYDSKCDAALPLDTIMKPDQALIDMLAKIDTKKYKVWALTNAYVTHATRVLKLLNISKFFEGVVSCDYASKDFACKPDTVYFNEAVLAIGEPDVSKYYFVDDSLLNIKASSALGWGHTAVLDEDKKLTVEDPKIKVINKITELEKIWPEVFSQ